MELPLTELTLLKAQLAPPTAHGHDLSLWGLFLQADIVVKAVMLLLLAASVWSWKIIIEKQLGVRKLNKEADAFEERFWSGGSLDDLARTVGPEPVEPMAGVFAVGMREWRTVKDRGFTAMGPSADLTQRLERQMSVTIQREMAQAERGMTFLGTVGSSAPFIGLFGTVWGIMNAFTSIAAEANTSLIVVAPGIAEALFATALGLLAAIPASAGYNKFAGDLNRFSDRLENFSGEFAAILGRHLDDRLAARAS